MADLNISLVLSHLIASIQSMSNGSTGAFPGRSSSIILPACFDYQCLFQLYDSDLPQIEHTLILCTCGILVALVYGGTLIYIIDMIKGTLSLNQSFSTKPKTPENGLCTQNPDHRHPRFLPLNTTSINRGCIRDDRYAIGSS